MNISTEIKINVSKIIMAFGVVLMISFPFMMNFIKFLASETRMESDEQNFFATVETISDEYGSMYDYYTITATGQKDDDVTITVVPYVSITISGFLSTIVVGDIVTNSAGKMTDGRYSFRIRNLLPHIIQEATSKSEFDLSNLGYGVAILITDGSGTTSTYELSPGQLKMLPDEITKSLVSSPYRISADGSDEQQVTDKMLSEISNLLAGVY